jgi:hypothetical protein
MKNKKRNNRRRVHMTEKNVLDWEENSEVYKAPGGVEDDIRSLTLHPPTT